MRLSDLTSAGIEEIHRAFIDAFSDYDVPLQLSQDALAEMLLRRGYDAASSVGVYEGDRLVAFTLNGVGQFRGSLTAYDTGTGVCRAYRGKGLTPAMLELALSQLAARGVTQYLLEVLTTNEKAERIYRRAGFEIVRELQCWSFEKHTRGESRQKSINVVDNLDFEMLSRFMDLEPSWQNSGDSIRRSNEEKLYLTAGENGRIVGYAVLYPGSGDVPQLAVDHAWRRRGIGRALLIEACSLAEPGRLRLINVDDRSKEVREFLERCGAEPFVRQFEMSRPIVTSI